jgi:CRP-like cAMP-binding protein
MQNIIETFRRIGNLSTENERHLLNSVESREYLPKTILQEEGKTSSKIYFVEKGIARTYYYKNGKDITYWIATENDFVGSMASFFMRTSSNKFVETLENCILWEFEYSKLEKLFSLNQEWERTGRLFATYGLSLMEKRFDDLHFNSAKERYDILINKQPEIIQRVPLGMIASYLGITQETLSRIRKQS